MASQLSKKAALPLAKILATCRKNVSNTGPWSSMKWIGQYMRQLSVKGALVERQWVANHWYRVTKVMYEDHPQRDTRGHSLRRRTLAIHNNSLLWVPSKILYDLTYAQDIVPMFCYVVCTTVISKMMKIHDNIPPIKGVNAVGVKHNWQQNSNFSTWLVVAPGAAVASDPCVCMRQYGGYKICYAVSTHFFFTLLENQFSLEPCVSEKMGKCIPTIVFH